jgi:hypothetical protein
MSRTNRRVAPTDAADETDSLPSVDTDFLRKLIKTGDTGFIDELVRKEPATALPYLSQNGHDELKNFKPSRRWPYVLFGMGLMYLVIVMTEAGITKQWWRFYMHNLKSSQLTDYDSMGLHGSLPIQSTGQSIELPASSLVKSATWEQSRSVGSTAASNNQQQQFSMQQTPHQQLKSQPQQQEQQQWSWQSTPQLQLQIQQPQQLQYPKTSGGLRSGTQGQQTSQQHQVQLQQPQQLQYTKLSEGRSSGTLGQQQQYSQFSGGVNSRIADGTSGLPGTQSYGNHFAAMSGGSLPVDSGVSALQTYSTSGNGIYAGSASFNARLPGVQTYGNTGGSHQSLGTSSLYAGALSN